MKNSKKLIIAIIAAVVLIAAIVTIIILVNKKDHAYRLVKVESFDGDVTVERKDKKKDLEAFDGMKLMSSDVVSIGSDSELELLIDDDKHLLAEENTVFKLVATGSEKAGKVKIVMKDGAALFEIDNKLNKDSSFEVSTPNAVLSVRGTKFKVSYDKKTGETVLDVFKGVVAVDYEDGTESEEVEAGNGRIITEDGIEKTTNESKGDKENKPVNKDNLETEPDKDLLDPDVTGGDDSGWTDVADDDKEIYKAYVNVIENLSVFMEGNKAFKNEYLVKDYMYFDYNQDGRKEIILYFSYYDDDNTYLRDVFFLAYDKSDKKIYVRATSYAEENDASFYAEYEGKCARYSWRTSPYESYLYVVEDNGDSLSYVLEKSYDLIVSDLEAENMYPLPLYGEWEMPPYLDE